MNEESIAPSPGPRPLGSGTARLRKRGNYKNRMGLKSFWLILVIFIVFGAGFVLSGGGVEFLRYLYNPVAVVVVIFAMIEYIVLKGRDRSRIYHLELEQLRQRRHEEIDFLRNLEEELRHLEQDLERLSRMAPPVAAAGNDFADPLDELRGATERVRSVRENLARKL